MHDMHLKFYEALWGNSSLYRSIWYGEKGKSPTKVKWFTDTRKALAFAESISKIPHYNVYHACSLFDTTLRQQIHVVETRAFWLDMDLNKTRFKTTKDMAIAYLPKFKKFFLGMDFWIIKTGNGLHVYWIMEESIKNWKVHAEVLRAYCKENNIKLDNARTCDSSSMMRFPASWNLKVEKPIKKAKMIKDSILIPKTILPDVNNVLKDASKHTFNNDDLALNAEVSNLNYVKSDIHKVAKKCALIKAFKKTGLDDSEPLWHQALSIIVRCENGAELAHEFSSQSPRYNKEETEQKLDRLISNDIGPCLCETFENLDDTYCKRCPLKSKLKSCIQLGATCKPINDNLDDLISAKQKKRAEIMIKSAPNDGWEVGDGGILRIVDDEVPVLVSRTAFYVLDKFCEDINDTTVITALIRAHTDTGPITFKLPLKFLAEDRKLMGEFNARGIFPFNKKHFKEYLTTYLQNISHIKPVKAVNSLGWQADGSFVYGSHGETFTKTGKKTTRILDTKAVGFLSGFTSKGTLTEWLKAPKIYTSNPGFMPHLFSLLCSFGAPLLPKTCATGFVLSFQSSSGSGKTMAHRLAMSVWGNPETAGSIGTGDSYPATVGRLATVKNLPLRIDEAKALESGLIYELVNGRGRSRCTIDGSLSNTASEWQTLTFITTNKPLLERTTLEITEAERYRILELHVPLPLNIDTLGVEIFKLKTENYGVAGKVFIEWVLRHKDFVEKTVNFYIKRFQEFVDDTKRFWVSCYAEAFTAATIINKIGLFEIDMPELYKWAVDILKNQSLVNHRYLKELRGFDTREELISALRDSLAGHLETVNYDNNPLHAPIREIKGRLKYVNDEEDILYVRAPALNDFIRQHFSESVQKVKEDFDIKNPKTIRLGKITARMYEFTMRNKKND